MRVLHLTLGPSPQRTGGLVGYCEDMARAQSRLGHEVELLYPGRLRPGGVRVARRKAGADGLAYSEVVGALPVALTFGVRDPGLLCRPCDPSGYVAYLRQARPDVIHVHTLMGFHLELFLAAEHLGIPMVYTAHDYYPMCPRAVLVDRDGGRCPGFDAARCARCNEGAGLSRLEGALLQEVFYPALRKSPLARAGKSLLDRARGAVSRVPRRAGEGRVAGFGELHSYYREIMGTMGAVFCSAPSVADAYGEWLDGPDRVLLPITEEGLERSPAREVGDVVRLGYFGGAKAYKGYRTLVESLGRLDSLLGRPWELHMFGSGRFEGVDDERVFVHGAVSRYQALQSMSKFDLVVVPSICTETFGLVVLEALCQGARVVCSDSVGARYLVPDRWVFEQGNSVDFAATIAACVNDHRAIGLPGDFDISMSSHCSKVIELYTGV